jgi:MFS transporter, PPP family, 3-phenylpropionic acid transporter
MNIEHHLRHISIDAGSVEPVAMSRAAVSCPVARLSAFYATIFLVTGIQLPFWPVWLVSRGFDAREIGLLLAAGIWVKVLVTPAIGATADWSGSHRAVMGILAAIALIGYAAMIPVTGLWVLVLLNIVALTAQSALMPIGDTVTLAVARSEALDYGRIRLWGSVSFILASIGSGTVLASTSGADALLLVLGASALLTLACLAVPRQRQPTRGSRRFADMRAFVSERRFWVFVVGASALQASHQIYYGFGTLYWRSLGFSEATIGLLWAEGAAAEILLFWHGQRLLARFGPEGLMMIGGAAGIIRWILSGRLTWLPSIAVLQLLHAFTFGASYLGAMHFLSRAAPFSAAGAQSIYVAVSSGLGGGLVMVLAGALYADYGGTAYLFMAILSAAGLLSAFGLRKMAR